MIDPFVFFIVAFLIHVAGSVCDIVSSLRFSEYGMREMNPWFRDRNGNLAEKKAILVLWGLCIVQYLAFEFGSYGWQVGVSGLLMAVGMVRLMFAVSNWSTKKRKGRRYPNA